MDLIGSKSDEKRAVEQVGHEKEPRTIGGLQRVEVEVQHAPPTGNQVLEACGGCAIHGLSCDEEHQDVPLHVHAH